MLELHPCLALAYYPYPLRPGGCSHLSQVPMLIPGPVSMLHAAFEELLSLNEAVRVKVLDEPDALRERGRSVPAPH